MSEFGAKLSDGNKKPIEDALAELRTAHAAKDIAGCDAAIEKLNAAWNNASQEMYAAQQNAQPQNDGAPENGNQEEVKTDDVEFEEVK